MVAEDERSIDKRGSRRHLEVANPQKPTCQQCQQSFQNQSKKHFEAGETGGTERMLKLSDRYYLTV